MTKTKNNNHKVITEIRSRYNKENLKTQAEQEGDKAETIRAAFSMSAKRRKTQIYR